MEPKIEQPKQYTPDEIAKLEKSRTISDADLLGGGAEYSINEKGEKENLLLTKEEKEMLHKQMESNGITGKVNADMMAPFVEELKNFLKNGERTAREYWDGVSEKISTKQSEDSDKNINYCDCQVCRVRGLVVLGEKELAVKFVDFLDKSGQAQGELPDMKRIIEEGIY